MPAPEHAAPPASAWDWLARQRVVWPEIARRLARTRAETRRPHPDVPDWSDLSAPSSARDEPHARRDWSTLSTRTEFMNALRADYLEDPDVRAVTDEVITAFAFLGRLDVPLARRGVLAPPRGMRWWWDHLGGVCGDALKERRTGSTSGSGGPSGVAADSETSAQVPVQLRLVDVLAGYGDRITAPPATATGSDS